MMGLSLIDEVMQMLKTAREWHLERVEPQTVGGVELWLIDDPGRGWVDPQGRIDGRQLERVARRLLFQRWLHQIDYHARGGT